MRRVLFVVSGIAMVGCSDTSAAPRAPLALEPPGFELTVGDTARFSVNGNSAVARWSSSSPQVASVGSLGHVTALAPGAATVWVVFGRDSASGAVTVRARQCILSVRVTPNNAILVVGDTVRVEASAGCPSASGFGWSTGDASVATAVLRSNVSGTSIATVTARGVGQVVVTATNIDDPTVKATMALTVRNA